MPASGSNAPSDPGRLQLLPNPMETLNVGQMTERVRHGDETAFDRLYELYCDRLYRYLLVLGRGQEELAREVLQGTWTKVIKHLPVLHDEVKLWRWLAAVARNNYFDALRRHQRAPTIIPLVDDQWPTEEMPPDDDLLFTHLEESLAGLDSEDQALLRGFYFDGQSHQQLADFSKTSAKAIESKLARLRKTLHQELLSRLRYEDS